jgi:hypothetical protein
MVAVLWALGVTADTHLSGKRVTLAPLIAEHVPRLRQILHAPAVRRRWSEEAASPQSPFDDPSATRFTVLLDATVIGMVQYAEEDEPRIPACLDRHFP